MNKELHKKALNLSYFTVGYNILEGILSIFAGYIAGSIALVGFDLDSFVESLSGGIMIWRFWKRDSISEQENEKMERKATNLVGITFFIFAAYVLFESLRKLFNQEIPKPSIFGIIIALVSIFAMRILYLRKVAVGKEIKSPSLLADSKQTLACIILSVALLVGLLMNYLFRFWQADPIVGLIVAGFLIREGIETLRKKELGCC